MAREVNEKIKNNDKMKTKEVEKKVRRMYKVELYICARLCFG